MVEIGPVVPVKKFLTLVYVFPLFSNYLPVENCVAIHLNKCVFPPPKDALC